MPEEKSRKPGKHPRKGPLRRTRAAHKEKIEINGADRLVTKARNEKRWEDKIIEPGNYDWKRGEEKDWEERE